MTDPGSRRTDEAAVLAELERLREAIRDARSRREQKVAEFESFVQTARVAARTESARAAGISLEDPEPPAAMAGSGDKLDEIGQSVAPGFPSAGGADAGVARTSRVPGVQIDDADPFALGDPRARRIPGRVIAIGSIVALLAIAGILFIARPSDEPEAAMEPSPSTTEPAAPPAVAVPGPGATAGSTPAVRERALQVELSTARPVWMRVVVDGEKVLERQVPGGEKLPFGADRAIAIRAGDAGAVRLAVGGGPATPMGRDGQVVSRTIAAPGR